MQCLIPSRSTLVVSDTIVNIYGSWQLAVAATVAQASACQISF